MGPCIVAMYSVVEHFDSQIMFILGQTNSSDLSQEWNVACIILHNFFEGILLRVFFGLIHLIKWKQALNTDISVVVSSLSMLFPFCMVTSPLRPVLGSKPSPSYNT